MVDRPPRSQAHERADEADDLFARGMEAGRRAAMREVLGVLEPLARAAGTSLRPAVRFAPGLDRGKLDRFNEATSEKAPEPMMEPAPRAPALPPVVTPPPPRVAAVAPPEPAVEPPPPPFKPTARGGDAAERAAEYVRRRATVLWETAKQSEVGPAARAESRAIAAELFEVAEELRRGEHLHDE
jgi:hypothetical protein